MSLLPTNMRLEINVTLTLLPTRRLEFDSKLRNIVDSQARSELRFWRGAEFDKVKNPKQLYTINLEKARKFVSF